jgi:hypothetical protein
MTETTYNDDIYHKSRGEVKPRPWIQDSLALFEAGILPISLLHNNSLIKVNSFYSVIQVTSFIPVTVLISTHPDLIGLLL